MERLLMCGMSDIGRNREHNEDNFLIGGIVENRCSIYMEIPFFSSYLNEYGLLIAVADGMGGHNAGEVASAIALNLLSNQLTTTSKECGSGEETIKLLTSAIVHAHQAIVKMGDVNREYSEMGTTIVGLYIYGTGFYSFHAGDSRLYRFRNGTLMQLTKDHSLVQSLVDIGQIQWDEAQAQVHKNVITNSLGGGSNKCEPEINSNFSATEGDIFLLCSDGLSDMVDIDTLELLLSSPKSLQNKVGSLINKANENGGKDNVTAVLVAIV